MLHIGWSSEFWADPRLPELSREVAGLFLLSLLSFSPVKFLRHVGGLVCSTFLFFELDPISMFGLFGAFFLEPEGLPGFRRVSTGPVGCDARGGGEGPSRSKAGTRVGLITMSPLSWFVKRARTICAAVCSISPCSCASL